MKLKRQVSANLGRTQHRDADKHYATMRRNGKEFKYCPFYGGKKYSHLSPGLHNKLNPKFPNPRVPIEEFDFAKKSREWDLQAYCRTCYKQYRRARIKLARKRWAKMSDEQIRAYYRKNIPGANMRCSVCKRNLDPKYFPISRSMEKGLHNECMDCVSSKAASVREQAWLSDGDWSSWREKVIAMRKEPLVDCAGWPPTVAESLCLEEMNGKRMHADHKVPLRAGGINDAMNFQPLCKVCNLMKSDQLDTRLTRAQIRTLVGRQFRSEIRAGESISTTERGLKAALSEHIENLETAGEYLNAIKAKKKRTNGQWDPQHAYRKGVAWLRRGTILKD